MPSPVAISTRIIKFHTPLGNKVVHFHEGLENPPAGICFEIVEAELPVTINFTPHPSAIEILFANSSVSLTTSSTFVAYKRPFTKEEKLGRKTICAFPSAWGEPTSDECEEEEAVNGFFSATPAGGGPIIIPPPGR